MLRVSGPKALETLDILCGSRPEPRRATLKTLRGPGGVLDRALVLRFDGPGTATGEDLVEYHLHGGRAVAAAVQAALRTIDGVRDAEPGEFTRRALLHGRMDLTEIEGLADLLAAETETQRRTAVRLAGGALARTIDDWTKRLLGLAAQVEAQLDFSDEDDVDARLPAAWHGERAALSAEIAALLGLPPAERLRDGVRIVIAGPPNSGKSTLFNALVGRSAAITSDIPGTTRDLIEAPVVLGGVPVILVDSAGIRASDDAIEMIGVERASRAVDEADIVLWLGTAAERPDHPLCILVRSKADLGQRPDESEILPVSGVTGAGIAALTTALVDQSKRLLPGDGEIAANDRQRRLLAPAVAHLDAAALSDDLLIVAEELRGVRLCLDAITGRAGVDDMLDALFGRFCIGK